jgi:hypothetical protein
MRCAPPGAIYRSHLQKGTEAPGSAKKLVGNEQKWPWAHEHAKTLMRHFSDIRAIDRLGEAANFSLSHGAVPLAAEQVLSDIARFEGEKAAKR